MTRWSWQPHWGQFLAGYKKSLSKTKLCPPSQEDQEQALSARGPQGHTAVRIPGNHPPEISSGEDSGKVALEEEQQHKEL